MTSALASGELWTLSITKPWTVENALAVAAGAGAGAGGTGR
jgi:hypothetical protein